MNACVALPLAAGIFGFAGTNFHEFQSQGTLARSGLITN